MTVIYTSLALIKSAGYLDIADTNDDASLTVCIEAASRQVERDTGRRFYAASETRTLDTEEAGTAWTGDLLSVTTLATDSGIDRTYATVWTTSDYEMWPANAALDGRPYRAIKIHPTGSQYFTIGDRTTKVTGRFGYCEAEDCPAGIVEAVNLMASRLHKRHKAIFGVSGTPEYGNLVSIVASLKKDPDYQTLVAPFVAPDRYTP